MTDKEINFLKETLTFWKKLNSTQQDMLIQSLRKKKFALGESMHSGSENCSGLFLLYRGQVRAFIISDTGKEITLYRLLNRDICIFSASCLMKNISFDIYVEAEKETEAFLIPTSVFSKLSQESLAVQAFTNELMASRFSEVMWVMEQVLFMSFDKRLALFLIDQSNLDGTDEIHSTHEKIANHLGTAREVVTRMLKYFQNEGMVSINRGTIEILDRDKLMLLAE